MQGSDDDDGEFPDDVEVIVAEKATQDISKPLVEPAAGAKADAHTTALLIEDRKLGVSQHATFLELVSGVPSRLRTVAVIGGIHHGKTSFVRDLVGDYALGEDEKDRAVSLRSHCVSAFVAGRGAQSTSVLLTVLDTPGHPDFSCDAAAALRLADVAVVCVDVAEFVATSVQRMVVQAVAREALPIVLVLTKVDRLIVDLQLSPMDAYRKIKHVIDEVNNAVAGCGKECYVSPAHGTVLFASHKFGFCFSVQTFAVKYTAQYPSISTSALARQLWGSVTFSGGTFRKVSSFADVPSFVSFVLEPLYKVVTHAIEGRGNDLLSEQLSRTPASPIAAVHEAMQLFLGKAREEIATALLAATPPHTSRTEQLRRQLVPYQSAPLADGTVAVAVVACSRLFSAAAAKSAVDAVAVVRVVAGSLRRGRVSIVNQAHDAGDVVEGCSVVELLMRTCEGFAPIDEAVTGQVVYVKGLGTAAGAQCVLVQTSAADLPLLHQLPPAAVQQPLMRVSIEPVAAKNVESFRRALKLLQCSYPGIAIHTEENGEYTVVGSGELQMDTVMCSLRRDLCPDVPVRLSNPYVAFAETVADRRGVLAAASTDNVTLGVTAGRLPDGLAERIERGALNLFPATADDRRVLFSTLRQYDGWDTLSVRRIVATGPDKTAGPNVLVDDVLEDHAWSFAQTNALVSGFRSVMQSGPLCGETVRGVRLDVIQADFAAKAGGAVAAELAVTSRRAVRQALFGANPRLLEPVLSLEIVCPPTRVSTVSDIVGARRGKVVGEEPIAATPLVRVHALVPAMDSFGLETQLRALTTGEAYFTSSFDRWDIVPGDPFDATVQLGMLEAAKGFQLARDFVVKTRHRKGLPAHLTVDL